MKILRETKGWSRLASAAAAGLIGVWVLSTLVLAAPRKLRDGDIVAFKSHYGKFLTAEPGGKLVANRDGKSFWESFSIEKIGEKEALHYQDPFFLRSVHGTYVGSREGFDETFVNGRKHRKETNEPTQFEQWILVNPEKPDDRGQVSEGILFLKSAHWKQTLKTNGQKTSVFFPGSKRENWEDRWTVRYLNDSRIRSGNLVSFRSPKLSRNNQHEFLKAGMTTALGGGEGGLLTANSEIISTWEGVRIGKFKDGKRKGNKRVVHYAFPGEIRYGDIVTLFGTKVNFLLPVVAFMLEIYDEAFVKSPKICVKDNGVTFLREGILQGDSDTNKCLWEIQNVGKPKTKDLVRNGDSILLKNQYSGQVLKVGGHHFRPTTAENGRSWKDGWRSKWGILKHPHLD